MVARTGLSAERCALRQIEPLKRFEPRHQMRLSGAQLHKLIETEFGRGIGFGARCKQLSGGALRCNVAHRTQFRGGEAAQRRHWAGRERRQQHNEQGIEEVKQFAQRHEAFIVFGEQSERDEQPVVLRCVATQHCKAAHQTLRHHTRSTCKK